MLDSFLVPVLMCDDLHKAVVVRAVRRCDWRVNASAVNELLVFFVSLSASHMIGYRVPPPSNRGEFSNSDWTMRCRILLSLATILQLNCR
jgi:hypothetical protein